MACGAKFDPDSPAAPLREMRCVLARGHKGWHEYATTVWCNDGPERDERTVQRREGS